MVIENHKDEVPFSYYEGLFRGLQPEAVAARLPGIHWDGKEYTLTLLGRTYAISWPEYGIREVDYPPVSLTADSPPDKGGQDGAIYQGGQVPTLQVQTFLLRYLLESKTVAWQGTWKTFREMPWGEMYIKPYTGRVLTRAAFTFGTRLASFKAACQKMGAMELPHGDAGFQFDLIGGYAMQILVWEGDDEFPPNAQVLYSDNFADGFAAEDRVVAGDMLISAIKANM